MHILITENNSVFLLELVMFLFSIPWGNDFKAKTCKSHKQERNY